MQLQHRDDDNWRVLERSELEILFPYPQYKLQQVSVVLHAAIGGFVSPNDDGRGIKAKEAFPRELSREENAYRCIILPRSTLIRHGISWFSVINPHEKRSIGVELSEPKACLSLRTGAPFAQMLILARVGLDRRTTNSSVPYCNFGIRYSTTSTISNLLAITHWDMYKSVFTEQIFLHHTYPIPFYTKRPCEYYTDAELTVYSDGTHTGRVMVPKRRSKQTVKLMSFESINTIIIPSNKVGIAIWSNDFRQVNSHIKDFPHSSGIWDPGFSGRGKLMLRMDDCSSVKLPSNNNCNDDEQDGPIAYILLMNFDQALPNDQCYNGRYQDANASVPTKDETYGGAPLV